MISYIVESTNEYAILKKSSFTTSFSDILFLSLMLYVILLQDIVLNLKYILVERYYLYNSSITLYNNHKLYTDKYYTSLKLATDLNKKENKFNLNYKEECMMCA